MAPRSILADKKEIGSPLMGYSNLRPKFLLNGVKISPWAPGLLYLDYVLNLLVNHVNDSPLYIILFCLSYNKSYSFLTNGFFF